MPADLRRIPVLFLAVGREMRETVAAPSRWSAHRWIAVFVSVAGLAVAYAAKWPIQTFVSSPRCPAAGFVAAVIDVCGSGYAMLGMGWAIYVLGRRARGSALSRFALALAAGGLWCWLLTIAGQWLLAEQRPSEGGAMRFFATGGHGVSGHASAAALLYSPVLELLAEPWGPSGRRTARIGLVGWAGLVGWSRVWLGRHFLWNVALGFAIGSFTGACAARVVASSGAEPR